MTNTKTVLDIQNLSHNFGPLAVLHDVQLTIKRGSTVALVGPSGCGKSTLLRAIVGTHLPNNGKIMVFSGQEHTVGRVVRHPGRDRGIVYQRYSLFPFLTARQNVAFGLMLDETSLPFRFFKFPQWQKLRKAHLEKADAYLEKVGLGKARNLYPSEMSGGMQQRVAIAQALIMRPEILLLDEPFGALDEAMREELQKILLSLYQENLGAIKQGEVPPYTILIVTHELNEAIYVSDRVVGLSQYWNWREEGHQELPGATIVYDKAAPIFKPSDECDYNSFIEQRQEIRSVVFDPEVRLAPKEHRSY